MNIMCLKEVHEINLTVRNADILNGNCVKCNNASI